MMDQPKIDELAQTLIAAGKGRYQIDQITISYPDISEQDAYAIQLAVMKSRMAEGKQVVGKKVALSNKAVQQVLGVYEPVWGHLTNDMFVLEGDPIKLSEVPQAKVEPEIAFVMKHDLVGPGVTAAQVLAATAGVMPAFDMAAPRIRDWKFKYHDMVADSAFSGKVVLGGKLTPIEGLDLRLIGVVLEKNGQIVAIGAGAAVLGHPASAVAALANHLGARGEEIPAGAMILTGGVTEAVPVKAGDHVTVRVQHLGSVSLKFV